MERPASPSMPKSSDTSSASAKRDKQVDVAPMTGTKLGGGAVKRKNTTPDTQTLKKQKITKLDNLEAREPDANHTTVPFEGLAAQFPGTAVSMFDAIAPDWCKIFTNQEYGHTLILA